MEFNLTPENVKQIEKYVKEGRFKNQQDFIQQAVTLMLYAEEKKDEFTKVIQEGMAAVKKK